MMPKQCYCMLQLNFCPTLDLQLQNSRTMFIPIFVPALSTLVFADSMNKSILVRLVGELLCKIIMWKRLHMQMYTELLSIKYIAMTEQAEDFIIYGLDLSPIIGLNLAKMDF